MWISIAVSVLFNGINAEALHTTARFFWWMHALVLLFFMNYLPYSMHLHVLTAIPNCFFRSNGLVSTIPRLKFKKGKEFGISKVVQFRWTDLLDFMACTECGRCQSVCPACNTNKTLNPKEIVHQGKVNLFANSKAVFATRPADMLAPAPKNAKMKLPLINGSDQSVSTTAIWDCTTCGVCMQVCPFFIEHAPKIVQMRQHLVMEKAEFPQELIAFFENSEQRSNPWGIAPSDRAKWATDLNVPMITDGVQAEYLFYVGCAGAFDSRARQVTVALTKILNQAGVSWGVLGNEEKCCGAGGGRMWMEELDGKRIYLERTQEALRAAPDTIAVACPYCLTMFEDGVKDEKASDRVKVKDIAEIVAGSIS